MCWLSPVSPAQTLTVSSTEPVISELLGVHLAAHTASSWALATRWLAVSLMPECAPTDARSKSLSSVNNQGVLDELFGFRSKGLTRTARLFFVVCQCFSLLAHYSCIIFILGVVLCSLYYRLYAACVTLHLDKLTSVVRARFILVYSAIHLEGVLSYALRGDC